MNSVITTLRFVCWPHRIPSKCHSISTARKTTKTTLSLLHSVVISRQSLSAFPSLFPSSPFSSSLLWPSLFSSSSGINGVRTAYVHPLSQIILEHFQKSKAGWIQKMGVEKNLTILENGTFEIKFSKEEGKIWQVV
uniref:Uncharacterized protein n=1 Tax=Corethron hystrix TaxID=216773 RepID=A0A7S1FZ73_9STRA